MIQVIDLTLCNYGSYQGSHSISLCGLGLTCLMGRNFDELKMGSNGSGKSTIFDALDWVLFGEIPKDDHVDSVINEVAGSGCVVKAKLTDDGHTILIERQRGVRGAKDGVRLNIDGCDFTSLDEKETQKRINKQLGLDREVFLAAVLFAQEGRFKFAAATDKERLEILSKVLQLGVIDEWQIKAKNLFNKNQMDIATKRSALQNLQQAIALLDAGSTQARIESYEVDRQKKILDLQAEVAGVRDAIKSNYANAEEYKRTAESYEKSLVAPEADGSAKRLEELESTAAAISAALTDARAYEMKAGAEYMQLTDKLQKMRVLRAAICSECGQVITEGHIATELARISKEIDVVNATWQVSIQRVKDISGQRDAVYKQSISLKDIIRGLQAIYEGHVAKIRNIRANAESCLMRGRYGEESIGRIEKSIVDEQSRENPYTKQLEELKVKEGKLREAVTVTEKDIGFLEIEGKHISFWVDAFGLKGLKNYILDYRLQAINDEANKWVKLLTGGTIWVRIETQTMGRSTGTLANKIAVRVFKYHADGKISERNYKSWSGGEKQRVALAIDFGLSRLIASRADKQWGLLLLDEVFQHLDGPGRAAVMEMLIELRKERDTILVIDHDAEFQAQFDNRIYIGKKNRSSAFITEETYYGKSKEDSKEKAGASASKHNDGEQGDKAGGGDLRGNADISGPKKRIVRRPRVSDTRADKG